MLFHGVNSRFAIEYVKMISYVRGNKEIRHWGGLESELLQSVARDV